MEGIISYSAYVPWLRLTPETIGWEYPFERAVANFDEDPITMGVAAGKLCLENVDPSSVKALLFCSASAPYAEKQNASVVASALNLSTDIITLDVGNSLRGGSTALSIGTEMLNSSSPGSILVIASDARLAMPRSVLDTSIGDGAAAILLGTEGVLATIENKSSHSSIMYDVWRHGHDKFVSQWEDRFVSDNGIESILVNSIRSILQDHLIDISKLYKIACNPSSIRQSHKIRQSIHGQENQFNTLLLNTVGNTGTAMTLMELCLALDQATEAGQYICASSYGDGVDTFLIKTTDLCDSVERHRSALGSLINSKHSVPSYEEYATIKGFWPISDSVRRPDVAPTSVPALHREQEKNIQFHAQRCNNCGYVQYPIQTICVNCQGQHTYSVIRLDSEKATLFTYSMDYLAGSMDVPLVICTVNFDIGGRLLCVMTDRSVEDIYVGMPLGMSFRKITESNGITSYFWKATPIRIIEGDTYERH